MKKTNKFIMLLFTLVMILTGVVYAEEKEYVVTEEYSYVNSRQNTLTSAFAEILIGSSDYMQYQETESIIISPKPTSVKEDKFGNKRAYFDLTGLKPGEKVDITIKRKVKCKTYDVEIPAKTNTEILDGFDIYIEPQEGIDPTYEKIVSKTKELTKKAKSDYEKASAIFEYVNTNMVFDISSQNGGKGSNVAIDNMRGTAEEFTTLFVAMCRSAGIPSRVVDGYKIHEQNIEKAGELIVEEYLQEHVIAEIYLENFGWIPVDPTVIYTVNGDRLPYYQTFGKMGKINFIAKGVYCIEDASRLYKQVIETKHNLKLENIEAAARRKNKFVDISNYDWAEEAIEFLYESSVINGYSEYEFKPQNNISRIEFISMLARTLRYKGNDYEKNGSVYYYSDYNQDHWSKEDYDYLMRCYQIQNIGDINNMGANVITEIFGKEELDMNKPITRAEVVALIDTFLPEYDKSSQLTDISGNKFERSIIKACNSGLINGYTDMTFKPYNNITRAEIAVILDRYIGYKLTENLY